MRQKPVQLTTGPSLEPGYVPSKDGKKIFTLGARQERFELLNYDAKSHKMISYLSGVSAIELDFSRDGNWVTYVEIPSRSVWRSRVDGSERLQLSFPPIYAMRPRWSPDGQRIAFTGFTFAPTMQTPEKVYLVDAKGGSPQVIIQANVPQINPMWLPDGNSLVMSSSIAPGDPRELNIYQFNLKTQQLSKIPGSEGMVGSRVSPEGRYIVSNLKQTPQKLMLFEYATQKWVELATVEAFYKDWSRDGKYVYFNVHLDKEPAIYRVRISDHKVERVLDLKELSPANQWFGLAPDDSILVARDISSQSIYSMDVELP